jgi:DNA repair exonuclease SbcCD ATPase subunit
MHTDSSLVVPAARAEAVVARAAVDGYADARKAADQSKEFDQIVEDGKAANEKISVLLTGSPMVSDSGAKEAKDAFIEARSAQLVAAEELKSKRTLVRGEFSGLCPVAGITCPAKASINSSAKANKDLHDKALDAYDTACRAESAARMADETAAKQLETLKRLTTQRDGLRDRAKGLMVAVKAAKANPFNADEYNTRMAALEVAQREVIEGEARVASLEHALDMLDQLSEQQGQLSEVIGNLREQEQIARAGLRIFGRQGAQKRIAETALAEIETSANEILRDANINLSIQVQWARDGVGLAAWCGECGAPFPSSARVKRCERCGADRGPKVVERLDIALSDRSGAAEDLAGAALQLSAASWLRRTRDVSWSVALIDEPFGSLDEANRRSFAAHLTAMLRGRHGFEQAFVVAHHPDVLDGLPGRVMVEAGADHTRMRVV